MNWIKPRGVQMAIAVLACSTIAVLLLVFHASRAKALRSEFAAIQDNWKRELLKHPLIQEVRWASSRPAILRDQGLTFMFKQATALSKPSVINVDGETTDVRIETTGYAVASRDADGRWIPTRVFIMEKRSPEEALAEMHKIRDETDE
jgi:hypothetical protein